VFAPTFQPKKSDVRSIFPLLSGKGGDFGEQKSFSFAIDCICKGKACGSGPKSSGCIERLKDGFTFVSVET